MAIGTGDGACEAVDPGNPGVRGLQKETEPFGSVSHEDALRRVQCTPCRSRSLDSREPKYAARSEMS